MLLRTKLFKVTLALAFTLLCSVRSAYAEPLADMAEATAKVAAAVRTISDKSDMGFYKDGFSLFGAYIREDKKASITTDLRAGTTYAFLGGGDNSTTDVDIHIKDSSGRIVAKDTDSDPTPAVTFKPRTSGKYTIELRLYSCRGLGGYCALALMQENGWDVPVNNLVLGIAKNLTMVRVVADRPEIDKLTFYDEEEQWSLIGAVVPTGNTMQLTSTDPGTHNLLYVAAGDEQTNDVDLSLTSMSGQTLTSDEAAHAFSVIAHQSRRGSGQKLKVTNAGGRGASFIVCSILAVK